MYVFYSLEEIKSMALFNWIDFSTFTQFESVILVLLVNIFYILLLSFVFSIVYKVVNRILNAIF